MQLTSLDWVIVVVSLVLCYLPAMFYLRLGGELGSPHQIEGDKAAAIARPTSWVEYARVPRGAMSAVTQP